MKTIGLLGGMSWESTLEYYRILNEKTKERLGGSHSAKCLLYSFDFYDVERLQHQGEWEELTQLMIDKSMDLKLAGADFIVICTNTMHLMADDIEKATQLKVLHIADVTGEEIVKKGLNKVALLGTKFTMESSFYKDLLSNKHSVEVITPDINDRKIIHDIIYNELILGIISDESKNEYIKIINKLADKGAQGVILGCTEIPLLIKNSDVDIEVFDTTQIHAEAAVKFSVD